LNQDIRRNQQIGRGLWAAALGTVNLIVLGIGTIAGAMFESWAVFALGGFAYLALCAWDLSSESFWKRLLTDRSKPEQLPNSKNVRDTEVRAALERIQAARRAIEHAIDNAPKEVGNEVRLSLGGWDEMEGRIANLVKLADALTLHLSGVDTQALQREAKQLSIKSTNSADPESRALYKEAAATREGQLQALTDVRNARERLVANLSRIVGNLESVPTRVVRMQVLDSESAAGNSDDLGQEIGRINGELVALEETLETLVSERIS